MRRDLNSELEERQVAGYDRFTSRVATASTKVLVIDDDPIVLEVVRERLEGAGFVVVVRDEPLGTTNVVRDERPDIVLLDIMMPALNGERLAALLRSNRSLNSVGIILHSSKSPSELLPLVDQTGAIGAISKSESEGEFMRKFHDLVRTHRERGSSTPVRK
jgi:PleD family two-component response regulator